MYLLLLSLGLGQCTGPNCPIRDPELPTTPTQATIRLVVEPADGEVWLDQHKINVTGRERVLYTPPLEPGKRFEYRVTARWGKTERIVTLAVYAGKTSETTLTPEEKVTTISDTDVKNFGIDLTQMGSRAETVSINGQKITKQEAKHLLHTGSLTDDSQKLRLTIIGTESDQQAVLKDVQGSLKDVTSQYVVQSYNPEHWAVSRVGFHTSGAPTIYVQDPSGKVLHRQDDYRDGADGLRKALEAIRKPDPNYDTKKDPDRRTLLPTIDRTKWLILAAAGVLFFLSMKRR